MTPMILELRLWLLCLIALLLPVQQAAAAAMLCPLASTHPPAIAAHAQCAETGTAPADLRHDRLHADGTCGVCAAFGSMMSLPSALPGLPAVAMSGTVFPPVTLPAVRFIADPRERPPRSC